MATKTSSVEPPNTSHSFSQLWGSDHLSDVVFLVGEEEPIWRIAAHKLVLSKSSDVFNTSFHGSFKEASNEIRITDIRPDIFDLLLKFLYTAQLHLDTVQEAVLTYRAAHKYNIRGAMKISVQFLSENLNAKNFFEIFNFMEAYLEEPDIQPLHLMFGQILDINADEVLESMAFLCAKQNAVNAVTSRGTLSVSSELVVFNALVRWASAECKRKQMPVTKENKRKVLGSLLFNCRFGLLSLGEVTQGPMKSGLLVEEDKKIFNAKPRLKESFVVSRIDGDMNYDDLKTTQEHKMTFIFSRNVIITAVTVTSNQEALERKTSIFTLNEGNTPLFETILDENTAVKSSVNNNAYKIEMSPPVYIKPDKRYILYMWVESGPRIISAEIASPVSDWFDGTKEHTIVWESEPMEPTDSKNTTFNTGQIFKLHFSLPMTD